MLLSGQLRGQMLLSWVFGTLCMLWRSSSYLAVLDFSDLYHMSCVLSEAGLASDAAFTIKEHFSTVPGLKSLNEVNPIYVLKLYYLISIVF